MADKKPRFAMPNGSYPIDNCADVKSAADLAHNSKDYSFAEVRGYVMRAAKILGCMGSLPETWGSQP